MTTRHKVSQRVPNQKSKSKRLKTFLFMNINSIEWCDFESKKTKFYPFLFLSVLLRKLKYFQLYSSQNSKIKIFDSRGI